MLPSIVTTIATTAVQIHEEVSQHPTIYNHLYKKFLLWLNLGKTGIVVLGRPNVGKTVLFDFLTKETAKQNFKLPKSSTQVESKAIPFNKDSKIVRIIPGQDSDARLRGISAAFKQNPAPEGVIYVTDWGFTDEREPVMKAKLKTFSQLQKHNLESEVKDFEKVCELIMNMYKLYKRAPKWLLVVTTKVDLFYAKKDEANEYYQLASEEPFVKMAQKMITQIGKDNIQYENLQICAWDKDFCWNNDTIPTQLIGAENRQILFQNFMNKIDELSK